VSGLLSSVPTTHVRTPFGGFLPSSVPCTHPPPLLMSGWPLCGDTQAEHQWTLHWHQLQTYWVLREFHHGGIAWIQCLDSAHAWILPMPGHCLCLDFAYAGFSPMPGLRPCLDFAHAWILPMPGHCLCLDFAYAWISPMPGLRPCLGFAHAWILPMPGFCPCLDFAYAWILPIPGFCPCLDFALHCTALHCTVL
jgi:hypothetical protein